MNKIGLVLAGGGGKGAYHIGVWRALAEFGVDQNIKAVAGTSVGALNGALFIQGDLEVAEQVWMNISPEKILTPDPKRILAKTSRFIPRSLQRLFATLSEKIIGHGWFSREGLLEIIRKDVNLAAISTSHVPCFATCLNSNSLKPKYFQLNQMDHRKIESVLLASSAIPFLFDSVDIDGTQYWDGGLPMVGDNLPIQPLYDNGCDLILAIHLNRSELIAHEQYPNAQIVEIIPQESQGEFVSGTLDFTPEGSKRRMAEGYDDTVRILKPIFDMAITQQHYGQGLQKLKAAEQTFNEKRSMLLNERVGLKNELYRLLEDMN